MTLQVMIKSLRLCSEHNGKLAIGFKSGCDIRLPCYKDNSDHNGEKRLEPGESGHGEIAGGCSFNSFERCMSLKTEGSLSYLVLRCSVFIYLLITHSTSTVIRPAQEESLCLGLVD